MGEVYDFPTHHRQIALARITVMVPLTVTLTETGKILSIVGYSNLLPQSALHQVVNVYYLHNDGIIYGRPDYPERSIKVAPIGDKTKEPAFHFEMPRDCEGYRVLCGEDALHF